MAAQGGKAMSVGERIRQARKEMGLTQAQLAEQCGLRQPAITKYENKTTKTVPEAQLAKIAQVLNKSVDWFYRTDDTVEEPSPLAALLDEIIAPPYNALTPGQVRALRTFFTEFKRAAGTRRAVDRDDLVKLKPKQKEAALKEHIIEAKIHRLPEMEVSHKAAAGAAEFTEAPPERLLLAQHRWQKGYRPFKILGDSMAPFIMDGDYVVVDIQRNAVSGDTVLARTRDGLVVKQFFSKKDHVELVSVNPEYKTLDLKEVAILGVLIDIVRPVKKITE